MAADFDLPSSCFQIHISSETLLFRLKVLSLIKGALLYLNTFYMSINGLEHLLHTTFV